MDLEIPRLERLCNPSYVEPATVPWITEDVHIWIGITLAFVFTQQFNCDYQVVCEFTVVRLKSYNFARNGLRLNPHTYPGG